MTDDNDARTKFFILSAIRLLSMALIMVGLLIIAGKLNMPKPAGYVFTGFGLLELLLLPPFLARKWKSPGK